MVQPGAGYRRAGRIAKGCIAAMETLRGQQIAVEAGVGRITAGCIAAMETALFHTPAAR